jgi:hypothetical protein
MKEISVVGVDVKLDIVKRCFSTVVFVQEALCNPRGPPRRKEKKLM